jgi:drug/metabolite transporter (DMT)-like permease
MIKAQRYLAMLLILIGASSYGLLSPLIKLSYNQGFTEQQITPLQMTTGTLIVWMILLFHRPSWQNPFKGPWLKLAAIGIFGLGCTTIFFNMCLVHLNVSLAIILLFQFTWITITLQCLSQKRKPTKNELLAILLIMLGTLLAVNVFAIQSVDTNALGLLFGFLSACSYSFFLFMTGRIHTHLSSLMKSAVMLTAASIALLAINYPVEFTQGQTSSLVFWGIVLGIFGQVIPTITFNIAIPKIGSSLSAILGSAELPASVIAALIILREPVQLIQWVGIFVIILGIFVSENKRKQI